MTALIAALALASGPAHDLNFRVMSYNIWVGGTRHQPLSQTAEAIRVSRANIVGIQEPGSNLAAIAADLGWNHSPLASVVTRYRIVRDWDVPGVSWGGCEVELTEGHTVFVYNCHLTAYPYGPYEVRDGRALTSEAAADVERRSGRYPQIVRLLNDMKTRVPEGAPIVLTGDFNAPSHLDWTDTTKLRTFNLVVDWPVSRAVHGQGFADAYRTVHPDPVAKPGFTWSPGYPVGNIAYDDVMDRIDFVYFKGDGLAVRAAEVVAETGPFTDIPLDPWPSDHRAVVASFALAGD